MLQFYLLDWVLQASDLLVGGELVAKWSQRRPEVPSSHPGWVIFSAGISLEEDKEKCLQSPKTKKNKLNLVDI